MTEAVCGLPDLAFQASLSNNGTGGKKKGCLNGNCVKYSSLRFVYCLTLWLLFFLSFHGVLPISLLLWHSGRRAIVGLYPSWRPLLIGSLPACLCLSAHLPAFLLSACLSVCFVFVSSCSNNYDGVYLPVSSSSMITMNILMFGDFPLALLAALSQTVLHCFAFSVPLLCQAAMSRTRDGPTLKQGQSQPDPPPSGLQSTSVHVRPPYSSTGQL